MPWCEMFCHCGYTWKSSVSAKVPKEDAIAYFLGKRFNVGDDSNERFVVVCRVEYHESE